MPPTSEEHLEQALEEHNDKIYSLENNGTAEELIDAYINRGSILFMMESYTSAMTDFDDVIGMIEDTESNGQKIDAGSYVKAFISRGEIKGVNNPRDMADDYLTASKRLVELNENSKYYDRKSTIFMSITCCDDIIDAGFPMETERFIDKALSLLVTKDDPWSRNRYMDILNIQGQVFLSAEKFDRAMECFSDAIEVGTALLEKAELDDIMTLVMSFVERGDIEQQTDLLNQYFADRKVAISLLDEMLASNRLDDVEILARLHQDVANTYLSLNNMKEAERYLIKELMLRVEGTREYIKEYVTKDNI